MYYRFLYFDLSNNVGVNLITLPMLYYHHALIMLIIAL